VQESATEPPAQTKAENSVAQASPCRAGQATNPGGQWGCPAYQLSKSVYFQGSATEPSAQHRG
jgi:hypothetical protein